MTFKHKLLPGGTILILIVLVGAGIAYYLSSRSQPDRGLQGPASPQAMQEFVQRRGEAAMRRQQALALIAIYEKMLPQFPDNADLKKKLAAAYRDAGREEEAKRLEEEIR